MRELKSVEKNSINKPFGRIPGVLVGSCYAKFQCDQFNSGQSQFKGPQDKKVKWIKNDYGVSHGVSPVVASDGTIYIQSYDPDSTASNPFSLFALKSDGSLKWKYSLEQEPLSTPAISSDGSIYLGSGNALHALRPDGTLKWEYRISEFVRTSPAINSDGNIYFAGNDRFVYSLDPNGGMNWKYPIEMPLENISPAIGAKGAIYIAGRNSVIYALNPNGSLKWEHDFGTNHITNPAVGPDGTIYIATHDLHAFNQDGSIKWEYSASDLPENVSVGSDGTVYYAGSNERRYRNSFNAVLNGSRRWSYTERNNPFGYPIIGSDGTIYLGSMGGNLYALDSKGQLKWKYNTGGIVHGSPAIAKDGTLYIINDNSVGLFALNDRPVLRPVGR